MESLFKDFSVKHLRSEDLVLLLIPQRRFSQNHTTAQDGSQSKAGPGLAVGLAVGHIILITDKTKVDN